MKFIWLISRSLRRNRRRNILTAISIAISIFMFCGLASIAEIPMLHHHLSSLADHELLALQSCQMLGNSWLRGADQVGDVLLAESYAQQRAARFLDAKVGAQFDQRDGNSFVQAKVQETRAAQQEAVPLLQIVAVKLPEGGLGSIWGNAAEISPAHSSNAAIVVGFALKTGLTERQRREIGNRARRQQRHGDTLVARGAACDPRNSCQQDVRTLGLGDIAHNKLTCEAFTDCQVGSISPTALVEGVVGIKFSDFSEALNLTVGRWWTLLERHSNFLKQTVREKIMLALFDLGRKFGQRDDHAMIVELGLSGQDLADLVKSSRPKVSECLKRLVAEGVVKREHRRFIIDSAKIQTSLRS